MNRRWHNGRSVTGNRKPVITNYQLPITRHTHSPDHSQPGGQILLIFALALAGLLAMFFFVVDVGRLFMAKQTLEAAASLAADAGASYAQDWAVARFEWQRNYADAPQDAPASFTPEDRAALAREGSRGVADDVRRAAGAVLQASVAAYPTIFAPDTVVQVVEFPYFNPVWGPNDVGVRVSVTARMPLAFASPTFGPSIPVRAEAVSRVTVDPCPEPCANQPPSPAVEIPLRLQNPDFEAGFQRVQAQELDVAIGWLAWFVDDGAYLRPEYKDATHPFDNRIYTGDHAQQFFRVYSPLDAGIYQTVPVPFKGRVRFSIQAQVWSTIFDDPLVSEGDGKVTVQVGIDPTGGSNPFSPNVKWSPPVYSYDAYRPISVEAFTSGAAVTVYTRARALLGVKHNDVYFDNAWLVMTLPQYARTYGSAEQPVMRYLTPPEVPLPDVSAQPPTPLPISPPTPPPPTGAPGEPPPTASPLPGATPTLTAPGPPAPTANWLLYGVIVVLALGVVSLVSTWLTESRNRG